MSVKKVYQKKKVKVTFDVDVKAAQNAKEINLLCDFNGWDPIPLTKKKSGAFSVQIDIPNEDLKEAYQYKFQYIMEDGSEKHDNDWCAEKYVANPFGGENSLFEIEKPAE